MRVISGLFLTSLFILNVTGVIDLKFTDQIEALSYDLRLRLSMKNELDDRVVIVDIDEKSLAAEGRWPWSRDRMSRLMDQLFDNYGIAVIGYDVVFAEKDDSSGLDVLERLGSNLLKNDEKFQNSLEQIRKKLDYDAIFGRSIKGRQVVLGYYFTDFAGSNIRTNGILPPPVFTAEEMEGADSYVVKMTGYGANLPDLQKMTPNAGHFTPLVDPDGVSRRIPLIIEYKGNYYESLSIAVVRTLLGSPPLIAGFPEMENDSDYRKLEWLEIADMKIPVDKRAAALVPYRGRQGSFRYVSATDVINGKVAKEILEGAIVLVGTTAPGLMDMRSTPVSAAYPGVEVHANMIAGILDQNVKQQPAYVTGAEIVILFVSGGLLSLLLPVLSPFRAIMLTLLLTVAVCLLNAYSWQQNMVLPLATSLTLIMSLFVLNMSYGFLLEARSKHQITGLFGQYVHPELVNEMSREPDRFTMQSRTLDMTVLFSDVCGFTAISEQLSAADLSAVMNEYLTAMTEVIQTYRGTIDKYIGDAIMAFWGAPLEDQKHMENAVLTAMQMQVRAAELRETFAAKGWPPLYLGIGVNTGTMNVGNMGSKFRMAYTVMGDAVNLGSRLESLTRQYGVGIIVGEETKKRLPDIAFRELDRVRVKGRNEPVIIYEPIGESGKLDSAVIEEQNLFAHLLSHYHAMEWEESLEHLSELIQLKPESALYQLYSSRIEHYRQEPPPGDWDGVFTHMTKG
ncbi:MAG: adenylate/guanylate cyclase domain-containing protein [Desulfuromonadaceae bacterium]|nr:adenylate/guanylate cyclase domain-containing protein [Desulfuromonadaceae bacterium]MDD2854977.1 adenylate/guanylate cyclase domain-containing protein [Desulfuromonadaceae bacterium]